MWCRSRSKAASMSSMTVNRAAPTNTVHVLDRLAGFDGESTPPLGTGDPEFPELARLLAHFASPFQYRPACTGDVTWKDWAVAQADIGLSWDVMKGANAAELFMTSPSPGQIAR